MEDVRSPQSMVRYVVIATWVWIAAAILTGLCSAAILLPQSGDAIVPASVSVPAIGQAMGWIAGFLLLLVAGILSAIWIYRMTTVKQALANGTSITSGWAVGWFFVPFLNLFKPFEGIKEGWQVATNPADWPSVEVPGRLRLWWGLWLLHNILDNVGGRLPDAAVSAMAWVSILSSLCAVPAGLLWIHIVRHISRSQSLLQSASVFR